MLASALQLAAQGCAQESSAPEPSEHDAGEVEAISPEASADVAAEAASDVAKPNLADDLLGKDRDVLFDKLVAAIAGMQIVSNDSLKRLGITWDAALAVSRNRFHQAQTDQDVYYALLSLQRSFHDIHSRLELAPPVPGARLQVPQAPPVFLPLQVRAEYEAGMEQPADYVVVWADPSQPGIEPGSRIVSVDGRPIQEVEREAMEWYRGSSAEGLRDTVAQWLTLRWAAEHPAPPPGSKVKLGLAASGEIDASEVELSWSAAPFAPAIDDPCLKAVYAAPGEDYASAAPEFVGINYCVYPTQDASTRVVRWFSFFYEFSDFSGGDPWLQANAPSALRQRMKYMSYSIPDSELPLEPGQSLPDGMLDPIAMGGIDIEALRGHLETQAVAKVLLDLRQNGGGDFDPSWTASFAKAPFAQPSMQVYYSAGLKSDPSYLDRAEAGPQAALAKSWLKAHPNDDKSPLYPFICQTSTCAASEVTVAPSAAPIAVESTLLAGPGCVSACDDFVVILRDNALAKLAGRSSEGGDSPVRVPVSMLLADEETEVVLVLTVAVSYRPAGPILQGNPPAPDVPVFPSASNRGAYLESVLQALGWK